MTEPRTPDAPDTPDATARRGRLQFDALRGLMRSEMRGQNNIASALAAARTAARFASAEGWATGPLWQAAGPDLLLGRWALDNGVSVEDVRAHTGSAAQCPTTPAVPTTAATPSDMARRPTVASPGPVAPTTITPGTQAPIDGRERPFG